MPPAGRRLQRTRTKSHAKPKQERRAAKEYPSTWSTFETSLQDFLAALSQEYITVVVTGSPSLVAVQGKPGTYLVCQAVMCSDKLL